MKWTDKNIDKLFQESAEKVSFDYKSEYWTDFEQSLGSTVPASDMSDAEIDALFQEEASNVSVNYKPEFWEEFSESLPIIVPTEEVTDTEVDELYRRSVRNLTFDYKNSYWEEMAALLMRRRRPDFLWFGFSGLFAIGLIFCILFEQQPLQIDIETFNVQLPANGTTPGTPTAMIDPGTTSGPTQTANETPATAGNNTPVFTAVNQGTTPIASNTGQTPVTPGQTARPQANGQLPVGTIINPTATNQAMAHSNEMHQRSTEKESAEEESFTFTPMPPLGVTALAFGTPTLAETGEYPRLPKARGTARFGLYVQGVGGISQSPVESSEAFCHSYGLGAGLTLNKNFWTFNMGTNFLIENHRGLTLSGSGKGYNYSSMQTTLDVRIRQFRLLEFDVSAGYNLGRHQFRLGVRPSLILNTNASEIVTEEVFTKAGMETNSRVAPWRNVAVQGVNNWGLKPTIGYAYNFSGGWTLGTNFGVEVLPAINNDIIDATNNTLHFDGQLYLRKSFNLSK